MMRPKPTLAALPALPSTTVLSIAEACKRLGDISRSTFYREPWLKARLVTITRNRRGIYESDVALYLALRERGEAGGRSRRGRAA